MRHTELLTWVGVLIVTLFFFPPVTIAEEIIGKGKTTAFYIDLDGDGYGVEAPLGPDCDDTDPAIHKPNNHIQAMRYIPQRGGNVYYIAPDGNNSTGKANDVEHPYATSKHLEAKLGPDDVIVFREGKYNLNTTGSLFSKKGTPGHPVTFMAYPGEAPVFERYDKERGPNNGIIGGATKLHDLVYDGLITENAAIGGEFTFAERIVVQNCVFRKHLARGFFAMQGIKDWKVIGSTFHDTSMKGTHGMYLGSRDVPNSNILIQGCLFYRNGRTGFQHNGPVTDLRFEDNIVHSNNLSGVSLVNGIDQSLFRNNVIFNNNKQAIVIQSHHNPQANEVAHTNNENIFINNTLWVGRDNVGLGNRKQDLFPCVEFNSAKEDSKEANARYKGNRFVNNICVNYKGPFVKYYDIRDHYETEYANNLLYHADGKNREGVKADKGDGSEDWSDRHPYYYWNFQSAFGGDMKNVSSNLNEPPRFVRTSLDSSRSPEEYNFNLLPVSGAIGKGLLHSSASPMDISGTIRSDSVAIGAYELKRAPPEREPAPVLKGVSIHYYE